MELYSTGLELLTGLNARQKKTQNESSIRPLGRAERASSPLFGFKSLTRFERFVMKAELRNEVLHIPGLTNHLGACARAVVFKVVVTGCSVSCGPRNF